MKETSARPRMGLVDAVGTVVAMATGRSSRAQAKTGLRATNRETNCTEREREENDEVDSGEKRGRRRIPATFGAAVTTGTGDARGRKE